MSIETAAASGQVCIRFIDGTLVSLSNSARMVLKEFPGDGNLPAALFDITRGDFLFVAGELAKTGNIKIDTPFWISAAAGERAGLARYRSFHCFWR